MERQSVGLRRLMDFVETLPEAVVLDLGGASQASIDHLAGPSRRLYAEDALRSLAEAVERNQGADDYLTANIKYPAGTFDAALCWNLFGCAPAVFLAPLSDRLHEILRPGGRALALLPASIASARRPAVRYEILGPGLVRQRDAATPFKEERLLTRREIDKLFDRGFDVTDIFTADAFHELLLVRRTGR